VHSEYEHVDIHVAQVQVQVQEGATKKTSRKTGGEGRGSRLINLFEIKTTQAGFCILNCGLLGLRRAK
jgi:hypothetical protein